MSFTGCDDGNCVSSLILPLYVHWGCCFGCGSFILTNSIAFFYTLGLTSIVTLQFNIKYFKKSIDNGKICITIVVGCITTMNSFEFLEKLGFSSNEAKVYGTLIKHKVLNGYEIAKLSGVARSLVYEVINRLIAKGAVIRIDGEPNFYKPIEYQELIRSCCRSELVFASILVPCAKLIVI